MDEGDHKMMNFEKYKNVILNMCDEHQIAIKNNIPVSCENLPCEECQRYTRQGNCSDVYFIEWLFSEVKPKLNEKEKRFLSAFVIAENNSINPMASIARDKEGDLYLYLDYRQIVKNEDGFWTAPDDTCIQIDKNMFNFITYEDEKPWFIDDLLKLEVGNC